MKNFCVASAMIPNPARKVRATAPATSAEAMAKGAIAPKKKCAFLNFLGIACERIFQILGLDGDRTPWGQHTRKRERRNDGRKKEDCFSCLMRATPILCHHAPRRKNSNRFARGEVDSSKSVSGPRKFLVNGRR